MRRLKTNTLLPIKNINWAFATGNQQTTALKYFKHFGLVFLPSKQRIKKPGVQT